MMIVVTVVTQKSRVSKEVRAIIGFMNVLSLRLLTAMVFDGEDGVK